jgi:hypothetical protein
MPPVIVWVLGGIGALAVAKWVVGEARRINRELHADPETETGAPTSPEGASRLRRDPAGVYRPD